MLALIFKCPENAACLMQSSELSSSLGKELRLTGDYQIQVIQGKFLLNVDSFGCVSMALTCYRIELS